MGEEGDFSLYDTLEDPETPVPNEQVQEQDRMRLLRQWIGELRPREQEILSLRYGLTSGEPMTLEQIGKLHGVTRERIRQIEMGAIRKLRRSVMANRVNFGWFY